MAGRRLTTKEFITRANKIHDNRYDYSKVEYINDRIKVLIICEDHGAFWQNPGHHIRRKHSCPSCREKNISITSIKNAAFNFIPNARKVHGDKYNYSKVEYIDAKTKVCIICPNHGEFTQSPNVHLQKRGCSLCGDERVSIHHRSNTIDFIQKAIRIHGRCYNYKKVKYIDNKTKVIIICKNNHEFSQSPCDHLQKKGCPHCYRKNEWKVGMLLKKYFKDWNICSQKKVWSSFGEYFKPRFCDFWLEKNNTKIMVEYDGEQHFRPVQFYSISKEKAKDIFEKRKAVDLLDIRYCKENDIILHRVKFDENKENSIVGLKDRVDNLWN